VPETVRPCRKCGGERHWTGSRWRCSPCYNVWQAVYKADASDEQKAKWNATRNASRAEWSEEYRGARNAKVTEWREANRERHRQGSRDWYAANAERLRAAKLAEYHSDPAPFIARNMVRKARRLTAVCEHGGGCVTAEFLAFVKSQPCVYCGHAESIEADHHEPLARDGLHCQDNIVPACLPCNRSKWAHDPQEWIATRESSA
jgi:hypothetical protein